MSASSNEQSERFVELDELIRAGWGDVPQTHIPRDWRDRPRPEFDAGSVLWIAEEDTTGSADGTHQNHTELVSKPSGAVSPTLNQPWMDEEIYALFVADESRSQKWLSVKKHRRPIDRRALQRQAEYLAYAKKRGIPAIRVITEFQSYFIWIDRPCGHGNFSRQFLVQRPLLEESGETKQVNLPISVLSNVPSTT